MAVMLSGSFIAFSTASRRPVIDKPRQRVNLAAMDNDDPLPRRSNDPLAALGRMDLDPLSVDELKARIVSLEAEIARTRAKIEASVNHRASAEALFRT